jgi:hypothetical protein
MGKFEGRIRKALRVGKLFYFFNMKTISMRLAFALLAFAVVFSSCKKEDENPESYATYDGKKYSFAKAFHINYGGPYQYIRLAAKDITWDQDSYTFDGSGDYIDLHFYLAIGAEFGGTYPFILDEEVDNSIRGVDLVSDATDFRVYTDEESTGSATIVKTGDIYEVSCTVTIAGKELKAYYKGELIYANRFLPGK